MTLSDEGWVRGLKQGDEQAQYKLWEWLISLAESNKYQTSEYEKEVARDAAVAAYERVTTRGVYQYEFATQFRWYCARIFVNEVNRAFAKRRVKMQSLDDHQEEIADERQETAVRPKAAVSQVRQRLQVCLEKLPRREKSILELLYDEAMVPQSVADLLNISRRNINVIAHRARKKLRDCLRSHGYLTAEDMLSL